MDEFNNRVAGSDKLEDATKIMRDYDEQLKSVKAIDLVTLDEHKEFISRLKALRLSQVESVKTLGENFIKQLTSFLSVGSDGIYTNNLRFLYELIQNVDDCDYADPQDRRLSVHFNTNEGRIVLDYNEVGFSPFNVYAITGIGVAAKNLNAERTEIGEKGIGFKSVFGIADRVLIQSGLFSFYLTRENFIIPEPYYEDFSGIKGTKLTVFLAPPGESYTSNEVENNIRRSKFCDEIYRELVKLYKKKDAVFTQNPLVFLNKLTKLRFFKDAWRYIEFSIERGENYSQGKLITEQGDEIVVEYGLNISCSVHEQSSTDNVSNEKSIECLKYSMPVLYDRSMCISRYGKDTGLAEKQLQIKMVAPRFSDDEIKDGALYSYLPTQIKTSVPIICHVPYKLTGSREYVDDQGENAWYKKSCTALTIMLNAMYKNLSAIVGVDIVRFIPKRKEDFFRISAGNDKLKNMRWKELVGEAICKLPIFQAVDSNYYSAEEICSFDASDKIEEPQKLYGLLDRSDKLFLIPKGFNAANYGIATIHDPYQDLFEMALSSPDLTHIILRIIDDAAIDYRVLVDTTVDRAPQDQVRYIAPNVLSSIVLHNRCLKALCDSTLGAIKQNAVIPFALSGSEPARFNIKTIISKEEPIEETDFGVKASRYLKTIEYKYVLFEMPNDEFLALENVLVLSKKGRIESLAEFASLDGKQDYLSATLKLRSQSDLLNSFVDSHIPPRDFVNSLRGVRSQIRTALGRNAYDSYIKLINEMVSDPKRFVFELIQNADDCRFNSDIKPSLHIDASEGELVTFANEVGFDAADVRSLTAIGESTKKSLLSEGKIGEKGIGFKSVFAMAESVTIQSNGYSFRLYDNTPTIPEWASPQGMPETGTQMHFKLKNKFALTDFSQNEWVSLCLCLKNLQHISVGGLNIDITDTADGKWRILNINGQSYSFRVYKHEFKVEDAAALKDRRIRKPNCTEKQSITLYIVDEHLSDFPCRVYCGLPTKIEIGPKLCIDAPFELTTSREDIIASPWNKYIKEQMYLAYAKMLEALAPEMRSKTMKLIRFEATNFGKSVRTKLFKTNSDWINQHPLIELLRYKRIVPTYDRDAFVRPADNLGHRYPRIIHMIMRGAKLQFDRRNIIENNPFDEDIDGILRNLGCMEAPKDRVLDILRDNVGNFITDSRFRKALYDYLKDTPNLNRFSDKLGSISFIPVKPKAGGNAVEYVPWKGTTICVDAGSAVSPAGYWLLDTSSLPKNDLERILNVDVQIIDDEFRAFQYQKELEKLFESWLTNEELYGRIINERQKGIVDPMMLKPLRDVLRNHCDEIPFVMEDGSFRKGNVFASSQPSGYFNGPLFRARIISPSSRNLADFIGSYKDICDANYDELMIDHELTADDIEGFQDDSIKNGYRILVNCNIDGWLPAHLCDEYSLSGYSEIDYSSRYNESEFPVEEVSSLSRLQQSIRESAAKVGQIYKGEKTIKADFVRYNDGSVRSLNMDSARKHTISRYSVHGKNICFCQMCRKAKDENYIEVNNIFPEPKFDWEQMHLALCLECSKRYESLRRIAQIRSDFEDAIRSCSLINQDIGHFAVKLTQYTEIWFTHKHIVEIQSIINTGKK